MPDIASGFGRGQSAGSIPRYRGGDGGEEARESDEAGRQRFLPRLLLSTLEAARFLVDLFVGPRITGGGGNERPSLFLPAENP